MTPTGNAIFRRPVQIEVGIRKGDIVKAPDGQSGEVMGVSMAGRATVRLKSGEVIAIHAEELQKTEP